MARGAPARPTTRRSRRGYHGWALGGWPLDHLDGGHQLGIEGHEGVGDQPEARWWSPGPFREPRIPEPAPTIEAIERPSAERPTHDTLDAIAEWLVGPVRRVPSGLRAFDEFSWRMLAAGLPLLRVTLHVSTLHPQYLGATFVWFRSTGQTSFRLIAHELADKIRYEDNPVARVVIGGETLRRRIVPDAVLDFPSCTISRSRARPNIWRFRPQRP